MRAGEVDGAVGEVGQRAGHAVERPEPGEVGRRRDQRRLPLHLPQQRPHRVPPRPDRRGAAASSARSQRLVRAALGQPQQRRRLAQREFREIGAVAAERAEQRRAARRGRRRRGTAASPFGEMLHQAVGRRAVEGTGQAVRGEDVLGHGPGGKA